MAGIPSIPATEGVNPTQGPTPGTPGLGFDGPLPNLHPTVEDVQPKITEVDWPPVMQQGQDDPADTPGWQDDNAAAINGGGQNDD